MAIQNNNTYSSWAQQISLLSNRLISKQGLCERMGQPAVDMVRSLLENYIKRSYESIKIKGLFNSFKRVLIQDSTTLSLPCSLVNHFHGNKSNGSQRAVARIQCVFDYLSGSFSYFGLHSYTENDQSAAMQVSSYIKKGDLIIRDLGYFTFNSIESIIEKKAFFVSRLPHNVSIFDIKLKSSIDILKLLRKKNHFDGWVLIGSNQRIKVRLIVKRVPQHIAQERRRKAKKNNDKRFSYSNRYLKLLDYTFYITNVEENIWNYEQVYKAYRVRWKVEIIFKSWKSHFYIDKLIHKQCNNYNRVKCIIYLMLLFIMLIHIKLINPIEKRLIEKYNKQISLLKIAKIISNNFRLIIEQSLELLDHFIIKYCCYETRNDRVNIKQIMTLEDNLP